MLLQLLRPLFQRLESLTKVVHAVHVRILLWLVHDESPPRLNLHRKKRTQTSSLCRRWLTCAVSVYVASAARSGSSGGRAMRQQDNCDEVTDYGRARLVSTIFL